MDNAIRSEKRIWRKQAVRAVKGMALLFLLSAVLYGCSKTGKGGAGTAAGQRGQKADCIHFP